jgi:hypothetical protein
MVVDAANAIKVFIVNCKRWIYFYAFVHFSITYLKDILLHCDLRRSTL